ncbi:MAG: hypothetical protein ACE5F9_07465 [Phycisphaerae bacterium]
MARRYLLLKTCLAAVIGPAILAGCRKNTTPTQQPTAKSTSNRETGDNRPEGADDRDDPHAPGCLPRSYAVGDWLKREPVRVAGPPELTSLADATLADRAAHFRIKSAAACAYALDRPDGCVVARVCLIEAERPEDAYGLVTCATRATETLPIGGLTRVERSTPLRFHTWQGYDYIRVTLDPPNRDSEREVQRLLMRIVAHLPREDSPALLEAMPTQMAVPGRKRLVRDLACLPPGDLPFASSEDAATASRLLGLGHDTLMCIADYTVPQAHRANTLWLVEYPDQTTAHAAHDRYEMFLTTATDPVSQSTNLMQSHGRFIIGTWTAEEESIQYMMPQIARLLPS